ncbi:PEP-CTERM sorting domain-containing protein [Massilia sp. CCM 9210]|uniref:PEP-CTERM sorting domain-containing protein n=1 Tax=Massilia scottii TaxID=3057166 RepID=UPI0027969004|nr:PEP-CTERM sorting domain-containing protein [Massilia sp. CCM 9210]MDQ1815278.1 PEP-CTERM sorting domain-containing protein [Massilia sp. CCM 9210]
MTSLLPRAALFAFALAAAPAFANGPITIDAATFSMENEWAYKADVITSDANGVTTIALTDAAMTLKTATTHYENGDGYNGWFGITLRPGYRMTGFSLSGTVLGELGPIRTPGGKPGDGFTTNSAKIDLYASSSATGWSSKQTMQHSMVDGSIPFVLASGPLSLTGRVGLSMWSPVNVTSTPYYPPGPPDGSSGPQVLTLSSMQILNPTLTIYTSAVPEPETYGMLLAGVAVIGLVRRRRRLA